MNVCRFEELALEIVEYVLEYEHVIVFTAILQRERHPLLDYLTIDEISSRTNIHPRDAMSYVNVLLRNKFLESCTKIVSGKRIAVYGINYHRMMNFTYIILNNIYAAICEPFDFHCEQCDTDYLLNQCLNTTTLVPQCICDSTHTLHDGINYSDERMMLRALLETISHLKDEKPSRPFVDYFKRVRVGDVFANERVVSRKS
jgi:hypothetical protein